MIDQLPISAEILLLLVAVGLYVVDVAQLLYSNEALLVRKPGGTWRAYLPNRGVEIARRSLLIPGLLQPGSAMLRLSWPSRADVAGEPVERMRAEVDGKLGRLSPLGWISAALLPQIFIALPLAFVYHDVDYLLVGTLAVIYAQVLAACMLLLQRRKSVGLGAGKTAALIFEALVCIPYAINLYRKATLQALPGNVDLLDMDRMLLSPDALRAFREELLKYVSEQLAWSDDNSAGADTLREFSAKARAEL